MAGKGSQRRPRQISEKQYDDNFHTIFPKKRMWWETKEHKDWVYDAKKTPERKENPDATS